MGFAFLPTRGRVIPERLADDVQYYITQGYVQQPTEAAEILDQRYVNYALARLEPYRPPTP
jgi:hypothetical protein